MAEERKAPRARQKNVTGQGKSVERRGSGTGQGPVGLGQSLNNRRPGSAASGGGAKPSGQGPRPDGAGSNPFGTGMRPGAGMSGMGGPDRGQGYGSGSGRRSGGGLNPLMLIIILAVLLLGGGGGLSGLLGGGSSDTGTSLSTTQSSSTGNASTGSNVSNSSGSGSNTASSSTSSSSVSSQAGSSGLIKVTDNRGKLNRNVSADAREKYTSVLGGGKDTITILVYLCGTDLESRSAMGTKDLIEMTNADISDKINLLVYTGGCARWQNKIISNSKNQIYRVADGGLELLEEDMGSGSMTNPDTLSSFLTWGKQNYPADRYDLILWDHGGGSLSGYGYDEKNARSGSMSLASLSGALEKSGMKFDFIGFDACLMATVENASMLTKYADYMIASEETEPGIGWYYTDWLSKLSKDTSMSTLDIGKNIVDDFVATCQRQCRGQSATLSVVDLAELSATLKGGLSAFSQDVLTKIREGSYKTVATARNNAREFAQSSAIDQIDFVDFANRVGSAEGNALCSVLLDAVKYNQTSSGINNAYGISVYFPYKKMSSVSTAVKTYDALGMDDDFTDCIREFASLELGGQAASQTSGMPIDSLFGSLFEGMLGGSASSQSSSSGSYSGGLGAEELVDLFSLFMGGDSSFGSSQAAASSSDLLGGLGTLANLAGLDTSFFGGRSFDAEAAAQYIAANHFDPTSLVWTQNADGDMAICLDADQQDLILSIQKNVLLDDGEGYLDLGLDNVYYVDDEGNILPDTELTWISINDQPVSYLHLDTVEDDEDEDIYTIRGKVPALLNGERVNLILVFDQDNPNGYIAGAQMDYDADTTETIAKGLVDLQVGDSLEFLCDYYGYDGEFEDSYVIGEPMEVTDNMVISDTYLDADSAVILYRFNDIYNQHYWTEPVA